MSANGELLPHAGGSPFVLSKQDWDHHKEMHGKLHIVQALQGSPVGKGRR